MHPQKWLTTSRAEKTAFENMLLTLFTTPLEGMNPPEHADAKYIISRFALMDRNISGIITGFYSVAVVFFRYIADNYKMLIDDIENGTISSDVDLPDETRESLLKKIKPLPERGQELRKIFKDGSDFKWVKKVWPKLLYMVGIGGDGFQIYDRMIKERFIEGDITNIYSGITASEGLWSVPAGVNDFDSVLAPGATFMEFLPVDSGDDFTKCVTMDKLEEGKIYEIIITNLCGFWRYRTSDAVLVTGFHNKTPKVQFMYRVNRTVNLAAEKTTEKALQITVEKTCEEMKIPLADFCIYPDPDANPNRYVFLIEPIHEITSFDMKALAECVYKHLKEANPVYAECVEEDGWLAKPEVYFLQPETSILYRDMMVYHGAALSQLKPVRVIANERQRKFFFSLRQD